ncbi:MAG: hypothetical protein ACI8P3_004027 [Saprospiraceae bacterium]|jgi:hypothetical protein
MIPTPGFSGNRIKLTPSGYLKAGLAALLIISAIILYVTQFDHFGKMLNTKYFLILSVVLGIFTGTLIGRRYAATEKEAYEQMRIYVICIMMSVVFMPLLVGLANRFLDFRAPQTKAVQLLDFQARVDQPFGHLKGEKVEVTQYNTVILLDEKIIKFSSKTSPFSKDNLGEIIEIPVRQGLLGIRYLDF